MKLKALRKCFVNGSIYHVGEPIEVATKEDAERIKHLAVPYPKDYVEPTVSERKAEEEAYTNKMEAAAHATSEFWPLAG